MLFTVAQAPLPGARGGKGENGRASPEAQSPCVVTDTCYPLGSMWVDISSLCAAPASRYPSWLCGNTPGYSVYIVGRI